MLGLVMINTSLLFLLHLDRKLRRFLFCFHPLEDLKMEDFRC